MRVSLLALAVLCLAAPIATVHPASAQEASCGNSTFGSNVKCVNETTITTGGAGGSVQIGSSTGSTADAGHRILAYGTGTDPSGQPCVTATWLTSPTPFSDGVRTDTASVNAAIAATGNPPCPGTAGPSPLDIVLSHLSEHGPPDPEPSVPSGYGITGLEAIIVTDTTPTTWRDGIHDTLFGPLALTGTAAISVDWGDGTTTGPHDQPGRPFPDFNIWHVYTDLAVVDIEVTYTWTIRWSFGTASGTVVLTRRGTVENFEIVDVQSVVTYGSPD